MMSLPVWLPGSMFFLEGLCSWSHVPSRGVYPGRGRYLSREGVSAQRGSL